MTSTLSRRDVLKAVSSGFAYQAFSAIAAEEAFTGSKNPLAARKPHFSARAKRVIFLSMRGAPSHVDTFDYKPKLNADSGKPAGYGGTQTASKLLGSPWEFQQHGQSGLWISSLFPHLSQHADDLCLLRGMHCDQPNHSQATAQTHTGSFQFVRPSLGAWTLFGLGSENENLPGFIALNPPPGDSQNFGSAFLPAIYQGTPIGSSPVGGFGGTMGRRGNDSNGKSPELSNIKNPKLDPELQRIQLNFLQGLNRRKLERDLHQPQVEGMVESIELAYRMQSTMPQVMDLSGESPATLEMYGVGNSQTDDFGRQCLLARRLTEAGVRFIELSSNGWDHHRNLKEEMEDHCAQIDRPIAALLTDLKRLDLLKDTLVIWAGEFGRTPHGQNGDGRDHNQKGYTTFMAGGGTRGGFSYGATDEYGYEAVEGRTHIHDWHATILHLLGFNHERLTFPYAGRDFRLTDVHGTVVQEILA
jgi:hypothetical protein